MGTFQFYHGHMEGRDMEGVKVWEIPALFKGSGSAQSLGLDPAQSLGSDPA
jgi:hypothetical protein